MEQVFLTIHALRSEPQEFDAWKMFPAYFKETWLDGEVTLWYTFEVTSFGGEIHFYAHVPVKHRNMIEASLYAHYSDIQISEVADDYIYRMPSTFDKLVAAGYNLFGTEFTLDKKKGDAYPIRTYIDFEAVAEEKEFDPISALLETLAKVKPQETVWLQIIARPVKTAWIKKAEETIDKVKERAARKPIVTEEGETVFTTAAPGEIEAMKAIARKISKPGFETLIRTVYISPKESHDTNFGQRGVFSALNQYATESYNKFVQNPFAWTRRSVWYPPYFFPKTRVRSAKRRMLNNYRKRVTFPETRFGTVLRASGNIFSFNPWSFGRMILNVEELATIFHLPTYLIQTGPLIKVGESRKVGPPAGLPIYGESDESQLPPGIK